MEDNLWEMEMSYKLFNNIDNQTIEGKQQLKGWRIISLTV